MNDTSTVQVRLVFPWPSTNVCSNISPLHLAAPMGSPARDPYYFTALTEALFRTAGPAGAMTAAFLFLASNQLCQNRTIGLATNTDEYVPIRMPTTSASENPCNTSPPNRKSAITVRKVSPE